MQILDEFLGNVPIRHKVTSIAAFAGVLVLVFLGISTLIGLDNNIRHQESMASISRQFALIRDITDHYSKTHAAIAEYLLFSDDDPAKAHLSNRFDTNFALLERDITELESVLTPLSKQDEALNKVIGYLYHLQNFRFSLPVMTPQEAGNFFIRLQQQVIAPLDDNMTTMFNAFVLNINKESESNQRVYRMGIMASCTVMILLFTMGIAYVAIVIRNIIIPLTQLTHATERFGKDQFPQLDTIMRKDELGVLSNKFCNASEEIKKAQSALEKSNKHLQDLNRKLASLSTTDPVTGISNRRALDEYVVRAWEECKRSQLPLTIMYLDIDRFKYYNDTFGHLQGDECLRSFAYCVQRCVKRAADMFARAGGEEFVAVLPAVSGKSALLLAEKIRRAVKDLKLPNPKSEASSYVTVSIGLATRYPYQMKNVQELMELADKLCYASKTTGRNRVTAEEEPPFDAGVAAQALKNRRAAVGNDSDEGLSAVERRILDVQ